LRVYVPATLPLLSEWLAAGQAPPLTATAVTPGLREWYREGNDEELEYAAQVAAARLSLALLSADPRAPRRRVVVAADVPDADVAITAPGVGASRAHVAVGCAVPLASWASALVDDDDAQAAVSAAVTALAAAEAGDEDAQFVVDEAEAEELGWWAVQELPHLEL
jgi:hypothetical protein